MQKRVIIILIFLGTFFLSVKEIRAACCEWNFNNVTRCRDVANDEVAKKWCITPVGSMPVVGSFYRNGKCNLKSGSTFAEEGSCDKGFELQVPFPGSNKIEEASGKPELLAIAIVAIFQFGVWIAISFSIFMIMIAGFIWLTSAGNQSSIGRAKGYITNAIVGLLIALFSYVILETINPQLVSLQMPGLPPVSFIETSGGHCCIDTETETRDTANVQFSVSLYEEGKDKDTTKDAPKTCQEALDKFFGGKWRECTEDFTRYGQKIKNCCFCSFKLKAPILNYNVKDLNTECYANPTSGSDCTSESILINALKIASKGVPVGGLFMKYFTEHSCDYLGTQECFQKLKCRSL